MKPKPLYRSLIFWSGILVMLFIGWAWRDSSTTGSGIHVKRYTAINTEGFVGVQAGENNTRFAKTFYRQELDAATRVAGFPITGIVFIRGQDIPVDQPLPEHLAPRPEQNRITRTMHRLGTEAWMLFIPHWLLLVAVALPWSGLLLWRARRLRAHKPAIAPAS